MPRAFSPAHQDIWLLLPLSLMKSKNKGRQCLSEPLWYQEVLDTRYGQALCWAYECSGRSEGPGPSNSEPVHRARAHGRSCGAGRLTESQGQRARVEGAMVQSTRKAPPAEQTCAPSLNESEELFIAEKRRGKIIPTEASP